MPPLSSFLRGLAVPSFRTILAPWAALLVVANVVAQGTSSGLAPNPNAAAADDAVVRALVSAEETSIKLASKMNRLSKGLLDLRLPGPGAEGIFAPSVLITDLGTAPPKPATNADIVLSQTWPVSGTTRAVSGVDLWRPLLNVVSWFDHVKVLVVNGDHPSGDMYHYESNARFEALARMKTGEWRSFRGTMQINWERAKLEAGEAEWQITSWKTESLEFTSSPKRLFVESLESALPNPEDLFKTRKSQHYAATLRYYREGMKTPPHPYFAPISANLKEGVSIVDIDADGYDDIYITVRLGKNMLLHNNRDGTFTEEAERFGLDLPGHTTCALFADFDNDGDLDVILGRSLLKSSYLENRGGKFYQPPIPDFMPMAAISMAAADYNGDGLLDVYICTYRPAAPMGASPAGGVAQVNDTAFDWPDEFFAPDLAREYKRKVTDYSKRNGGTVLDQLGPPNVLLVNRGGGRFEPAPENNVVGVWRNSLQATWCDYNMDGRPDLYIANDWAWDHLFRNDGPAGFTDVSQESGITSYGFAMGASWGDYDNDGREDVYISNMYSEVGRRMTTRIPGISKAFIESASGNYLYHKEANKKFRQVGGLPGSAMPVMNAGWSWGGMFVDFDNDTFLDLYVLSGYFTAPKELASDIDLESNLWRTMVRSDENLGRASFRSSPEWKRTPAPDNLGPQIDTRLSGVDRQGEKMQVHSLNGNERNHYFANRNGTSFTDVSGLSGLDNPADSRGFAVFDYDRDGWQDVALVNANEPMFNLYHNEIAKTGRTDGMIAIRFVGGNKTPSPSKEFACRDGYGARVTLDMGSQRVMREHRCGDGWAAQNSATMIVGIGSHKAADSLVVKWPSGKTATTTTILEGTLLTIYENPADSPSQQAFVRKPYRPTPSIASKPMERPLFAVRSLDAKAKPAKVRLYFPFATGSPAAIASLPTLQRLKEQLGPEGADIGAVTIDPADDNGKFGAYNEKWKPNFRLVNIAATNRAEALAAFAKVFGQELTLPCTVLTDNAGKILAAQRGLPTISEVRKHMADQQ